MNIEELRKQFIVDEDVLKVRLEPLVASALRHCRIDKNGQVLATSSNLSGRDQVKLVLAARAVAAQLDENIRAEVTVAEIEKYTGLPGNQVRARGKECIEEKFATSSGAGVYRAIPHKIEVFLENLSTAATPKGKK
jgi:hypothetical protein